MSFNLKTDDRQLNGAPFTVKKLHYLTEYSNGIPSITWVDYDRSIGLKWIQQYHEFYNRDIHKKWTPIFTVNRQIPVLNEMVPSTQYSLKQATAGTVHGVKVVH